jgi:hypothetical protein
MAFPSANSSTMWQEISLAVLPDVVKGFQSDNPASADTTLKLGQQANVVELNISVTTGNKVV